MLTFQLVSPHSATSKKKWYPLLLLPASPLVFPLSKTPHFPPKLTSHPKKSLKLEKKKPPLQAASSSTKRIPLPNISSLFLSSFTSHYSFPYSPLNKSPSSTTTMGELLMPATRPCNWFSAKRGPPTPLRSGQLSPGVREKTFKCY